MRRLLMLALVSLCAVALVPLVSLAASSSPANDRVLQQEEPPSSATPSPADASAPAATPPPQAATLRRTVTATGTAVVTTQTTQPMSVYAVQVMGPIDQSEPTKTYDAYIAKMNAVRDAVIASGVRAEHVTTAVPRTESTGPGQISFNSIFHFRPEPGLQSVSAPQAAWDAGASMVYNNMPGPQIGAMGLEPAKLDAAIAEARELARRYAQHAALPGETIGEEIETTLVIDGQPERDPTEWRISLTIRFGVER